MSVILSSETADAARWPEFAADFESAEERLAVSLASFEPSPLPSPPDELPFRWMVPVLPGPAPTRSPGGKLLALRPLDPSPVFAVPPVPFDADFGLARSGVPEAPCLPWGPAENDPRRFPAGTAIGPVGVTGLMPSAVRRPCAPPPAADALGAGATP